MSNKDIGLKAVEALEKLREHPAIAPEVLGDSLFDGMWFHMSKCCKNGQAEYPGNQDKVVHKGEKGWEKWKDLFEEEYKDDPMAEFQCVSVPYEEYYGEPWVFDHVEYWYEIVFFVFTGNPYDVKENYDYKNWGRYGGPEGGANSFDEMLIQCWEDVKKVFGDYKWEDFDTPEEIANHEDHHAFLLNGLFGMPAEAEAEAEELPVGSVPLIRDEEYLDVTNAMYNLRWLDWFRKTDYCKKNWCGDSVEEFEKACSKLKECEPEKRKSILKKYKK